MLKRKRQSVELCPSVFSARAGREDSLQSPAWSIMGSFRLKFLRFYTTNALYARPYRRALRHSYFPKLTKSADHKSCQGVGVGTFNVGALIIRIGFGGT